MPKHPFKLAVAALFVDKEQLDCAQVIKCLDADYKERKILCTANVENALHSLKVVGILKNLDGGGYALTAQGRARVLKYL